MTDYNESPIRKLFASELKATLEEALGRSLPELNEPGWMNTSGDYDQNTRLDRLSVNREAQRLFYLDPTIRHMVTLHSAFTFGRGISYKAADKKVNKVIERFWKNPRNRQSFSTMKAQWRRDRDMQLFGEQFLVFFTSTQDGTVTVRSLPPEQITRIVKAPGDSEMPLYFVREYIDKDGKRVREPLPDYRLAEVRGDGSAFISDRNTEVAVMHLLGSDLNGRGISHLTPSIPWAKAKRGFMEDRATLTLALALFAFKLTASGNKQALQRIRDQFAAYQNDMRYGAGDERERREGANIFMGSQGMQLEQFRTDSGAANAYQDMRMFRQETGIGMSIFEHYLGDPSTGNLATATAMELPMLKVFEAEQQFWDDIYTEVFNFVIRQQLRFGSDLAGLAEVDLDQSAGYPLWLIEPKGEAALSVETVFPPIIQRDLAVWSTALSQAASLETTTGHVALPPEQAMQLTLQMFGLTSEAPEIIEEWRQRDFKSEKPTTPAPPPGSKAEGEPEDDTAASDDDVAEAIKRAVEAVKKKNIGNAPPKAEIEKVNVVTKGELKKAAEEWAKLPSLDALAKDLNMTLEELDAA